MRFSALLPLILAGMTAQSALGLTFNPYRDIDWVALGWLGNDSVTLVLVCPLLAVALSRGRRNRPRWQVVRLGVLGYAVYNYAFYMLGASLNAMFPLYVALFVAAVIALVSELPAARIRILAEAYSSRAPTRLLGGYLTGVGVCLSAVAPLRASRRRSTSSCCRSTRRWPSVEVSPHGRASC